MQRNRAAYSHAHLNLPDCVTYTHRHFEQYAGKILAELRYSSSTPLRINIKLRGFHLFLEFDYLLQCTPRHHIIPFNIRETNSYLLVQSNIAADIYDENLAWSLFYIDTQAHAHRVRLSNIYRREQLENLLDVELFMQKHIARANSLILESHRLSFTIPDCIRATLRMYGDKLGRRLLPPEIEEIEENLKINFDVMNKVLGFIPGYLPFEYVVQFFGLLNRRKIPEVISFLSLDSLFIPIILLSMKYLNDQAVWNSEFSAIRRKYDRATINRMEVNALKELDYAVCVSSSEMQTILGRYFNHVLEQSPGEYTPRLFQKRQYEAKMMALDMSFPPPPDFKNDDCRPDPAKQPEEAIQEDWPSDLSPHL